MNVRIIDLLSLESRGMELPTKIRVFGHTFIYTGDKRPQRMYKMENQDNYLLRDFVYTLNTEVEILEEVETEEKKIPEKLNIEQDTSSSNYYIRNEYGIKCGLTKHSKMIAETLNQLIDYLKSKGE